MALRLSDGSLQPDVVEKCVQGGGVSKNANFPTLLASGQHITCYPPHRYRWNEDIVEGTHSEPMESEGPEEPFCHE